MSVPLSGLSIEVPSTLYAGQTITAIAKTLPVNAISTTIIWSIDEESIATVDQSGLITVNSTIGPSSFNLTITNGDYSQTVNISVIPRINSISFSLPDTTTSIGYILSTGTTVVWNDGADRSTSITYTSSKPRVANVDSSGNITAIANGTSTIITATVSTLTTQYASTMINVRARPNTNATAIISGSVYVSNIYVGKFSQAYLVLYPYDVEITSITWSVSDPTVAYIDSSTGQIIGIKSGSCIIGALIENSFNSITVLSNLIYSISVIDSIILTPPSIQGLQIAGEYTSSLSGVLSFFPSTATYSTPTWTSLNPEIATVITDYSTNTLTINGITNGATLISVVSGDPQAISTMMYVSVGNGLNSITTNSIPSTFLIGNTFQANITASGTNSMVGYYTAVQWNSTDLSILTVSSSGFIKAVGQGTATLSATASGQSGSATYSMVITVNIGVNTIVLSPVSNTIQIGSTYTLSPTIFPVNAENKSIQWSSSMATVATVDSSGNVLGIASGSAVITARSQDGSNISSTATVYVGAPITSASIVMSTTTLYIGSPVQASVSLNPTSARSEFTYWNPKFTAINTYEINTIQQVTDTGIVIPGGLGSSTFTLYTGNQYGSTVSTISPLITILSPVKAILVSPSKVMTLGSSSSIVATVVPDDASVQTLTWKSSSPAIASVDSSGLVNANTSGTAYITATTTDGTGISATVVVIVS